MKKIRNILVTKPYFPSLKKFIPYLEKIWKNEWLTNNGPMVRELEQQLTTYLGVKHVIFVANGTIALQLAIKALHMEPGEIITTPLSFAATTNAIIAEGFTPIFADIDVEDYSLRFAEIEKVITPMTRAILPVHVYGYPCNVRAIEKIAKRHNIKVIYDAAHSFGTRLNGTSLLNFGDMSIISFHATKLFHTGEGGAIITNNDELAKKLKLYRNFGNNGEEYYLPGINAKNSELHAALGLVNLQYIAQIISRRKKLTELYDNYFAGTHLYLAHRKENITYNFAYYPVLFTSELELLGVMKALVQKNIYPRRYFYPSLNELPYVQGQPCPIAEAVSRRILCLPLYNSLQVREVEKIAGIVVSNLKRKSQSQMSNLHL